MKTTDLAIVGAGPLGIELAVAAQRAGMDCLQFDARQIGQTIAWFPPQTRFFSSNERIAIAGVPLHTPDQSKATREQYLAYLRSVVQQFDLAIHTYEPVTGITRDSEGFAIHTRARTGEHRYRARRVALVTGGTARPRKLEIEGESLPHVHPFWKDPHDYFRTRVLVIGGRNSAVETALRLHHAGANVSISYRGAELPAKSIKYWLMPEMGSYIKHGQIKAYFNTVPVRITPGSVTLASVGGDAGTREVQADFVIPQVGYIADMSLARAAGVELQPPREVPVFNPQTMETNIPGLYICGTAIAGTQQRYEVFIENGHAHVERIIAHITGKGMVSAPEAYSNPES